MGRQQGIASHVGAHLAVAQDEMRQDGEDDFTRRTLDAPDGEAAQADPDVMGMTCQIPATTAGGLVFQLKAEGEDERDLLSAPWRWQGLCGFGAGIHPVSGVTAETQVDL